MDISKLGIDQLVTFINLELKKNSNLSVNKLCDKLDIKRSTLKTKLQKENYSFNNDVKQYEKKSVPIVPSEIITDVIKNDDKVENQVTPSNDDSMNIIIENDDANMTFSHQMKNNLITLANNYDKIMLLINSDNSMSEGITIELPVETEDNYRTTIRVNNVVWESFKGFCVQNKMFTQRDLLSMALTEYMNKYKK